MGFQSKSVPEEILKVDEVTVSFGAFTVLRNLTFTLERGELRVVIGPNGAGKTTLLDLITGKTRPTRGRVLFQPDGKPTVNLTKLSEQRIARLGIGRKFQTPNTFKSLTVLDNLKLALKAPRGVLSTLLAVFKGVIRSRVEEILETIGLQAKRNALAGTLAHGEKQWLELGMLMAQDPEMLLIDEPVAGMSPSETERTGELLLAMARRHTLLVIDHDMTFVRQIAMRVTVLHEGEVLSQGTIQEVQRNPKVIEVYLGQDRENEDDAGRKSVGITR
jgi:urea transport system ATP-binding protein